MALSSRSCVFALFWAIASLCPGQAAAQVHRCTGLDGADVYTDRKCADISGVEQSPRSSPLLGNTRASRGSCARNLQDLVDYRLWFAKAPGLLVGPALIAPPDVTLVTVVLRCSLR